MHIVAHRGYSGKYPELSPEAFEKALQLPIHGVECDVQLTRDGQLVVNHDETLDRTSDRSGTIAQMDWEEVRKAKLSNGENIMSFAELLELIKPSNQHLYVETKQTFNYNPELEEQVLLGLRHAGLIEDPRVHLISFSHRAIRKMAHIAPWMDRFYLRREFERIINRPDLLLSKPTGLGLSLLRGKLQPQAIGAHGLPTYMWTVDSPEDMKWAWSNGVDILATNQPEVALHAINY
ncbi:glycerophosphodiester phosphodiesterase [Corynebacterium phocae]|uniref:Glycerophosphodiester phosphodiesterase n=1 Tax=Corynebacterium phocae TaxID=161895 RepID=A0A1L7D5X3_9CORY|nr:glycerophosphodiester phosphodiesterase family protein [Corynebacterium phocae]APT93441.1 glycerophosphodiester phosphodiesterase [Corynebacterium phocae]KAA8721135.1 glycerophosphodiester phosphodiesterase [Corynebacterium phocae]